MKSKRRTFARPPERNGPDPFKAVIGGIRNPRVVHVVDEIWAARLETDAEVAFINLAERLCTAHADFPCPHVEQVELERGRLRNLFDLPAGEPIPDSDRLMLRAIRRAVFGSEAANG